MNLQPITCITFDLDDTLWHCAPVIQQAEGRFYHWLTSHYPEVTARFTPDDLLQQRIQFAAQHPQLRHNLTRLRKAWLTELASNCRCDRELVETGFSVYWHARNDVTLFDDVRKVLAELRQQYVVGVITNGNANVELIGIDHLFDFVVTSEMVGVAKPDKQIFSAAAELAGVPLSGLLHVGDDPEGDVLGAMQAGAHAAWVTPGPETWRHALRPDLTIGHIRELLRTQE